ncbi:FtsB family cell division protein [Enterococcus sp. HY326]|uniref:FtsB family cell division protein n=1 Tax=Enterococcus sp. HY326 TaxID=2971265 RepID=UPI00223F2CA7|nr:septum formation initiator family protein [Enterococcus sp. HY326]
MSKDDKITKLTNDYTKEQYAQFQKQRRQVVFKRRRLFFICLVAIGVFAFMGYNVYGNYQKLANLEDIKSEAEVEAQAATDKVADLQTDVGLLQDDQYVLKLARDRLFYSREGESVYVLPSGTTESSNSATDSSQSTEDSTTSASDDSAAQ